MLLAAINRDLFLAVKAAHLVAVTVGFGGVMLAGVYARRAARLGGTEGLAIAQTVDDVSAKWAAPFQYAVIVTGVLLVLVSDSFFKFEEEWISVSIVIYLGIIAFQHAVQRPNYRRMAELRRQLLEVRPVPPALASELDTRARRAEITGAVLDLAVVGVIAIMLWKPGR